MGKGLGTGPQSHLLMAPGVPEEWRAPANSALLLSFITFSFLSFVSVTVCECPLNISVLDKSVNSALGKNCSVLGLFCLLPPCPILDAH